MKIGFWMVLAAFSAVAPAACAEQNLIANGTLEQQADGGMPTGFETSGAVHYGYLGDARRDTVSRGCWLLANEGAGELSTTAGGLDAKAGRWFRFTFRGLPQANFAVANDDLYLKVAFFGRNGTIAYDVKERKIYDQVRTARRDLGVNGNRRVNGAAAWRTYQLDFMLPFPQVDQVRLSVGFAHGAAGNGAQAAFLVDDLCLVRIPEPPGAADATARPTPIVPQGRLLPLGGRWFYVAGAGETTPPKRFDGANADRLLYHDDGYSAPFAGNTSAWLRMGNLDADGNVVQKDRLLADNVSITFTGDTMAIHTHGVPNHPTGRFPEQGFGNPSYIQDREATYTIPLKPRERAGHIVTNADNSNGALHMGPIGIAVNGVVFFNPFDAGNQDATDLMDRCCGHPNPDNQYHYHKYPICVNSPWADEGRVHSPLLGWAFDGYPLYGPYETADGMAKDLHGDHALNAFNMHYDEKRGWHYHVTPGKFPYLIGGFWGVEDARNAPKRRGPPPGGFPGGGFPPGGPPPPGFPPPPPPWE